jgi:DNA-binding transcriptional ArsR family regulator
MGKILLFVSGSFRKSLLTYIVLDSVLHAIAEPHRREILRLLQYEERSSGEIAARFDVTRPAISQHLGVLAGAGLLTVRKEGTRRLYRTRPEGLIELRQFLEGFWDDRLLRLKEQAEREERRMHSHGGPDDDR